jgi:FKBP-type peptidyl-prolyl cis-trans isomerase (trigger factor)
MSNTNKKTKAPVAEQTEEKVTVFGKVTPVQITAVICAVIILGLLIAGAVSLIVDAVKRDVGFSYADSNMEKYIDLSGDDYNKLNLKLDIADTVATELRTEILSILNKNKPSTTINGGRYSTTGAIISAGDAVRLYYRGYVLNEDGTRDYQPSMTNLGGVAVDKVTPSELVIGSGSLIPGFEAGLEGKAIDAYPTLTFIKEGAVSADYIVFVSYSRKADKADSKLESFNNVLVDLSLGKEKIDDSYGDGFYDLLVAQTIAAEGLGANLDDVLLGTTVYDYSVIKVNYAMAQYDDDTYEPVAVRFPAKYNPASLQNKEAWFEIYTVGVKEYYADDKAALTDEMVTKELAKKGAEITAEELETKYPELATLAERYTKYLEDEIQETYDENYDAALEVAIINHYLEKTEVKKWPGKLQTNLRNQYIAAFKEDYQSFLQSYSSYYNEQTFPISQFAQYYGNYYGITNPTKWEDDLVAAADREIKINMIVHYIIQTEDIDVSEDALRAEMDKAIEEKYDTYKNYFLQMEGKDEDDYKDNEEGLRADVYAFAYEYDEDNVTSTAYYNIALAKVKADFIESAKVLGEE